MSTLALSALALGACGGASSRSTSDTHSRLAASTTATKAPSAPATRHQTAPKQAKVVPGPPNPPAKAHGKQGPGGSPATLWPELTVAELERKANAVCKAANGREAALSRPGDVATNSKAAAAYLRQLTSIKAAETSALHLNAPPSLRALYARFVVGMLREQSLLILAAGHAQTGQPGYVKQYQAALSYDRSMTAPAARQLQLSSCG